MGILYLPNFLDNNFFFLVSTTYILSLENFVTLDIFSSLETFYIDNWLVDSC